VSLCQTANFAGRWKKKPILASEHMLYIHRSSGSETEASTSCTGCIHSGITFPMSAFTRVKVQRAIQRRAGEGCKREKVDKKRNVEAQEKIIY